MQSSARLAIWSICGTFALISCGDRSSNRNVASPQAPSAIDVTKCEAKEVERYGTWQPSDSDVDAAIDALPEICVPKTAKKNALRVCQAKLGQKSVSIGIPIKSDESPAECSEDISTAEWNGRHFIVAHAFYQYGAKFSGTVAAVEIGNTGIGRVVIDNAGLVESCKERPKVAPDDWAQMPHDLQNFLCGWR